MKGIVSVDLSKRERSGGVRERAGRRGSGHKESDRTRTH